MPFVATAGSNSFGQLGRSGDASRFGIVALDGDVRQVACGAHHTLVLTVAGVVYGWGRSAEGQLGVQCRSVDAPRALREGALAQARVVRVAAGEAHSLFLSVDGAVSVVGSGADGQLGDGTCTTSSAVPRRVALPEPAVDIACGWRTCFAISAAGVVYGWGESALGALGACVPVPVVATPTRLSIGPARTRIARVVASGDVAAALTHAGEVLVAGNGAAAVLGPGLDAAPSGGWRYLRAAGKARDVAVGAAHVVVLPAGVGGGPLMLGGGRAGPAALGLDGAQCDGVAAGADGTLLWGDDGALSVVGPNRRGQLGIAAAHAAAPVRVPLPAGLRVVGAAAGKAHAAVLLGEAAECDLASGVIPMEDAAEDVAPLRAEPRWEEDITNVSFTRSSTRGLVAAGVAVSAAAVAAAASSVAGSVAAAVGAPAGRPASGAAAAAAQEKPRAPDVTRQHDALDGAKRAVLFGLLAVAMGALGWTLATRSVRR